jgi:cobalamin biosynthesis protein CbiD
LYEKGGAFKTLFTRSYTHASAAAAAAAAAAVLFVTFSNTSTLHIFKTGVCF